MEDRRNIVLAILLSALILFGWPYVAGWIFPTPEAQSGDVAKPNVAAPAGNPDVVAPPSRAAVRSLDAALGDGPRIRIATPKLAGSLALKGARIDDLLLTRHRVGVDRDTPPVRLLSPAGTERAYFSRFGWASTDTPVPDENTLWQASGQRLTPETPVTLSWDNGAGVTYQIVFAIDRDYLITATQRVTNRGPKPVRLTPYGLVTRTGMSADHDSWNIHVGPVGVFGGSADYDWDYTDLTDTSVTEKPEWTTTGGWLGFGDLYWLTALVPDQTKPANVRFRGAGNVYQAEMTGAQQAVAPGRVATTSTRLFAGAKEVDVLDRYEEAGIVQMDLAIDWGWFIWIEKPFFWILDHLFKLFKNFGLAIMGLTLIVRLALFPIAQRQFQSMAQLRAVAPKMKALQDRHKDDKPKLQQEMMQLYKDEKVNPLGGCLPIFLQIPIFFALYKLLMLTIEMRHQPFALWIRDLSAPDPAHILNLFGLLPFTPPAFLGIGVLAVLLGLTMWAQQKLNPPPTDPVQAQVFAIMPWMLMFVMAPFAAGLLLYWITNNILSIAQQQYLYSRNPQLKAMMAAEAEERARKAEAEKAKAGA